MNDRIAVSPNICHSQPRVAGTRVMVHQVLDLLAAGKTVPEITADDYSPDLTDEDVLACITCASEVVRSGGAAEVDEASTLNDLTSSTLASTIDMQCIYNEY